MKTLYICYFGVREPLVQTQVLPYLTQLAIAGITVHLLTFEPRDRNELSEVELENQRTRLATQGISWFHLPYHKRPTVPATIYDIGAGARFAIKLVRREGINVLHARAHVPMAMALLARRFVRVKIIFDIRGLMAEEYADAGIWSERSLPFRFVKRLERVGIRRADQIVVLTTRLRDWLVGHNLKSAQQIEVIPCCVDFARFDQNSEQIDEATPVVASDRFTVVYAGSLTGLYLTEAMGHFFREIKRRRPNAFLRILSISPPELGATALGRAGVNEADFEIVAVSPAKVPAQLRRANLGVSFRKPAFAQIAASPTKIPEYLAAGLPVVCNAGVGDMDELVEREQVGVVLPTLDDDTYQEAAARVLTLTDDPEVPSRCRRVARGAFDLQTVGQRYVSVYRRLQQSQAT